MIYILTTFQGTRGKTAPGMFEPEPSVMLSARGQRIVSAYESLQNDVAQ